MSGGMNVNDERSPESHARQAVCLGSVEEILNDYIA